jgi:hypothetical protein
MNMSWLFDKSGGNEIMKGSKAVLLLVIVGLVAIAAVVGSISIFFKNNETQSGHAMSIEGTVAKKDDASILVISGKDENELKGKTEEEMLEGVEEAIWFSLSIDQTQQVVEFDNVRIKYSHVNESFPGKASANSIEILDDESTD